MANSDGTLMTKHAMTLPISERSMDIYICCNIDSTSSFVASLFFLRHKSIWSNKTNKYAQGFCSRSSSTNLDHIPLILSKCDVSYVLSRFMIGIILSGGVSI